jgi:hypothetical protein
MLIILKLNELAGSILARIANSHLAVVFSSFMDAVRVRKERKDLCQKIVGRMLHAQLSVAFELYYEGICKLQYNRHMLERAMTHWRRPELAQAWDIWLVFCQMVRDEIAAEAAADLRHELAEKCRQLEDGLLANRQRQKLKCERVVDRMMHSHLAAVFDGFVACVVASHERRELAYSVVRRMQRIHLSKAFDKFVNATRQREGAR